MIAALSSMLPISKNYCFVDRFKNIINNRNMDTYEENIKFLNFEVRGYYL